MDLSEFRAAALAFLDANAARKPDTAFVWGEGDDDVSIIEERQPDEDAAELARSKEWAARRFDEGFGWIDGPEALGGRGLTAAHRQVYRSLESGYAVPDQSYFTIGLGMVAPTIAAHATGEVQQAYLKPLHRGDLVACQLFSEPGAGSDLAGLSTRATRDGDDWVVTGQKIWTSNAHLADLGEIICRTDFDQPKHKGLTGFIVDMHARGIQVRPLRQMTGGAGFNEVFFDEVRIPDSHRLGDVNAGWTVALTTLANERASLGSGMGLGRGPGPVERLIALARHFGRDRDPVVRDQLARMYTADRIGAWTLRRGMEAARRGGPPGAELSVLKLAGTQNLERMARFVGTVLGPRLLADSGEWGTFAWSKFVCGVPGGHLGGGTDEVLRNILGERVLGLPKDLGIDARTPFSRLPR